MLALPLDPKEHTERKAKAWKGKMVGPFRNLAGNPDNRIRGSAMVKLEKGGQACFRGRDLMKSAKSELKFPGDDAMLWMSLWVDFLENNYYFHI